MFAIGAVFAVGYGLLISRAVFFHLKDNTQISKVAMRQYRTAVKKSTERGKILDSAGRELAINVSVESVYADPRFVRNKEEAASRLGLILNTDSKKILNLISANRKFVWIKRRISKEEAAAIAGAKISGIYLMSENGRYYPNGELGSSVIGTVDVDAGGIAGIEYQYNDILLVNTQRDSYKRDARGHLYLSPSSIVEQSSPANIELTIDKTIQYIAEREISGMVASSHAKSGTLIVLDAVNGDVLAMAGSPSFDPNNYGNYSPELMRNRAVTDVYEPGSTFKAIVIAAALDHQSVTKEQIFDCGNGKLKVGKMMINDAHPHKKLSVADIVKVSSNIGAARIEQTLGRERAYKYIESFGFGKPSGLDSPGESAGLLSRPDSWSTLQFLTIAFGQGIGATPIQMAVAFAALVNGGELLRPHVVKRILNQDGTVLYERKKEVRGRPIKETTSALMRTLLRRVVEAGGTGILAASSEYPVGGKTGTAQKAGPYGGYLDGRYYASFIGFAPADNPRIVVYAGIDEPRGYYYGGQVAAPVFKKVTEEVLHYLNVPAEKQTLEAKNTADLTAIAEGPLFVSNGDEPVTVPQLQSAAASRPGEAAVQAEETTNELREAARQVRIESIGDRMWRLPDFRGLTMKEVMDAAGGAQIDLKLIGSGIAIRQEPPAGSVVKSGASCRVEFENIL
jgi:cell division protein FtsI (penicillin-binding protein 3)